MQTESSPTTLPRRVLGRRLRELREARELSCALAAKQVQLGAQTLWRLESGRGSEVKRMVINALCDLYESEDSDRRELLWLAEESRKEGWWQSYTDALVPQVEVFLGLEQAAKRIVSWQRTTLPGLVQTPGYRRAMGEVFGAKWRAVDREREIDLVAKRQARLDDVENFSLEVLLCESVLRHCIGSRNDMAEQLEHLLRVSERPNVSIRVVEFSAPNHLGLMTKDFVYMEFPEHLNPVLNEPPVVYVEGFTGNLYLDKPNEIAPYQAACASIAGVALDERETRRFIEARAKEYKP
ncbi:helix-turn-helix domain-containing protein [Nocardia cyriacigeorgica]|uniref:Helix-turn-helix domain-containing protein n=1 Tax=Nocardia cyriacigeorgica TaxID=135487 RepID=A0A6P1CL88_9NOCA|nr:helix-turn-helix transcriptional regulator [Nocardia cyriacigeorgica]MBF6423474.1 helix-turn-helix domain-containing protein [Nocardia cyriacigeorgica]NEW32682.1 helix-turn-helix domain-containing protein [Nocardia cyriacigeorgica]